MNLKRCQQGHFFDPLKHSSCPFCGVPDLDIGKTRPKKAGAAGDEVDRTRPKGEKPGAREPGKTVGRLQKQVGMNPVVGWLVCVKGADRGRDYRIRGERNFIGRSERMDICIAGDEGISRERHAVITYNPKRNSFKFSPGESNSLVCVNGEDIEAGAELKSYDRIQLGDTELIFIPLCGEKFQWLEN